MSEGERWEKNRVEAFSDGVFAIAITLLVLDITVPPNLRHLGDALEHEWPTYLAYVTSFLTVGGVWIAHHRLFRSVAYADSMMMRINLLLLMLSAFLPFPTKILAEALRQPAGTARVAVVLYGATVLAIELVLRAFLHYVAVRPELSDGQPIADATASSPGRWWLTPVVALYAAAIVVGLFGPPKLAAAAYLVLALPGVLLLGRHRHPREASAAA